MKNCDDSKALMKFYNATSVEAKKEKKKKMLERIYKGH